ncbi:MAG: alanine racemase [Clostridia bacterium]|nr:alanine racemase [Clostridia bacterium]
MKVLEINSKDLEHNINKIKERAGKSKVIAVVKGNGYGLGLIEFSSFLINKGIDYLAVSSVEEALELKSSNLEATVLCLSETPDAIELEELLDKDIIITIGNYKIARKLNEIAISKNKKAHVHLKIDTGFSRYGFKYDDKENILKTIKNCTSLFVDGVFSHFSCAYFENDKYTKKQFNRFLEVRKFLEDNNIKINMYHICNSSSFLKYEDMFMDAVRVGSAFLGRISVKNNIDLKKIGILKSNIVEIKNIEKNEPIGYSNSEIAKKQVKLAIVPVGYADGFNVGVKNDTFKFIDKVRILKNSLQAFFKNDRIYVLISGKEFPVIGKVGMNHIAVDITGENIKLNTKVKLEISPILVSSKIRREYV